MAHIHLVVEIEVSDEFVDWYRALDDAGAEDVAHVVGLLENKGVALEHPYSSKIHGASFALRELRIPSRGRPLRVFYAFDPRRQAFLILGGDKAGDKKFYERMIPICERIWREYLEERTARR